MEAAYLLASSMRNAGGNSKVEGPANYSLVLVEYIPISLAAPEGCLAEGFSFLEAVVELTQSPPKI
jgi:hypothetical protein